MLISARHLGRGCDSRFQKWGGGHYSAGRDSLAPKPSPVPIPGKEVASGWGMLIALAVVLGGVLLAVLAGAAVAEPV